MTNPFFSTEGIILRAIPYRDFDQILFIFTANAGLIKIICYGSRSQKSKWRSLCLPLTRVEVVYREKQGEIFECRDMSLIDTQETLKQQYLHLEVACDLLQALMISQMPCKEAQDLYALLLFFLKKIPTAPDPWILAMSFRLKLLWHEGLVVCPLICQHCQEPLLHNAYFNGEEWSCARDQSHGSLQLTGQELQIIYQLTASKTYQNLRCVTLPEGLRGKIEYVFLAYWKES